MSKLRRALANSAKARPARSGHGRLGGLLTSLTAARHNPDAAVAYHRGCARASSSRSSHHNQGSKTMAGSTIATKDGVEIFYKDWGAGQPIVFSHGWPLSADDWDAQMMFFVNHGFRVIAHDRRGHGRSSQTSDGHDMDHYADDLATVTAHLDLKNAVHVGHSTGGGEVVRYLARHGERRVAKAALISAVPPLMLKAAAIRSAFPRKY